MEGDCTRTPEDWNDKSQFDPYMFTLAAFDNFDHEEPPWQVLKAVMTLCLYYFKRNNKEFQQT